MTAPRVVLATFNPGKMREILPLFDGLELTLTSLGDCGIEAPFEESGATYEENARAKAQHYARLAGCPAVADDSGIEIDALGGRPGPLSARYGGEGLDDAGRCRLMLKDLSGVEEAGRTGRYVAVAAIARPDGASRLFRGVCEGRILTAARGEGGFGYDPLFYYPPFEATFAEVTQEKKERVSHRGRAFRQLAEFLGMEAGRDFMAGLDSTADGGDVNTGGSPTSR